VAPEVIVVPLRAGSRRLGALRLERGRPHYGEDDLVLAEALADRIAVALENARLHTERSRIAETLQQSLLPPVLPAIPGLEVAAAYAPADDAAGVGGDFYDLFESEPGVWTVLLGDVAGKGAEAASLTSLARYTLRTASMLDTSPAHNLRLLNEALLARDAGSCTVVYARLTAHGAGARLTAAAAGHPPPLVLRASGGLEELTPPGTLLGAIEAPRLQTRDVELGPGDLVVFYTDGATDVRVAHGVLGDRVLRETLSACGDCTARQAVERIAGRVRAAQNGRLDDDLALLALRVVPPRR
jgi:serine phosphatase RsbU (regulator of sigma subunit)